MQFVSVTCNGSKLHISLRGNFSPTLPVTAQIRLKEAPEQITASGSCLLEAERLSGDVFECRFSGASRFQFKKCKYDGIRFDLSGASEIRGKISTKRTVISVVGSSRLKLAGKSQRINADISGASHADFEGTFRETTLEVSGASHVTMGNVQDAMIRVSGASHMSITAEKSLAGHVNGASHVTYSGVKTHAVSVSGASSISR